MWLNSELDRQLQQRMEDKGNAVPCGHHLKEAEPKGYKGGQKKGSTKKQECPFTECAFGSDSCLQAQGCAVYFPEQCGSRCVGKEDQSMLPGALPCEGSFKSWAD